MWLSPFLCHYQPSLSLSLVSFYAKACDCDTNHGPSDLGFELFVALSFAWDKPETQDGLMRMSPRKPVNQRSITSRKKKALRRTKTVIRDPETDQVIPPSRFSLLKTRLLAPFTREFWEDRFEATDDETLVDGKLLSYAYLEAGVIEMVGA
jgi:sodium/potassium-transporting ATPase subunit alpha